MRGELRTLYIGMRRGNSSTLLISIRLDDLIAFGINNARAGFVSRLKLNLALKRLDLFLVQKVAKLIAILNLFLTGENALARRRWGTRNSSFWCSSNRNLILPAVLDRNWRGARLLGCLHSGLGWQ